MNINDIIPYFIYEGKTAQIAQNTLIKNIEQGGLKLYHYPTKINALKLAWVKRFCNEQDTNWKVLPKLFLDCDSLNLYFSANHNLLTNKKNTPSFILIYIICMWITIKKEHTTADDMLEDTLWLNISINIYIIKWYIVNLGSLQGLYI